MADFGLFGHSEDTVESLRLRLHAAEAKLVAAQSASGHWESFAREMFNAAALNPNKNANLSTTIGNTMKKKLLAVEKIDRRVPGADPRASLRTGHSFPVR
jgi:hypothetical protein